MKHKLLPSIILLSFLGTAPGLHAAGADQNSQRLKEKILLRMDSQSEVPQPANLKADKNYPWKTGIVATVFWVGETPTANNPVPNNKSSWDTQWARNYGGYDNPDPKARSGYLPAKFVPRQNPFYVALPYNDVSGGKTKREASAVIPWFKKDFVQEGQSVCKGRWVAIRYKGREVFAQWEDCGPFRTDHWQYVFGNERPRPNLNQGAGIDLSPAVRDYLGMQGNDVVDWRFVEFSDVPRGPWALHGDNNTFVQLKRQQENRVAANAKPTPARAN